MKDSNEELVAFETKRIENDIVRTIERMENQPKRRNEYQVEASHISNESNDFTTKSHKKTNDYKPLKRRVNSGLSIVLLPDEKVHRLYSEGIKKIVKKERNELPMAKRLRYPIENSAIQSAH
ncbi:unnamed protein product [Caenorhabditis bovis]|uniref:Uncharacterized protein n=1 Tax=Caenorhabditis bovis TaxID=2654633 RepID=A0A8S1ERJ1_9PELO|nr:unnamed protein product [Caenorhabditis bovis]